jgi:hypothetical protein
LGVTHHLNFRGRKKPLVGHRAHSEKESSFQALGIEFLSRAGVGTLRADTSSSAQPALAQIPTTLLTFRRTTMQTLIIKDLSGTAVSGPEEDGNIHPLSREEMKRVQGGRAVSVMVDGRPGYVMDDFQLQTAIFEGRIKVTTK